MSEVTTRLFPALADRYRIEREIGSGGMATVYLARDLKHDRDVALKVLRPELAAVLGVDRFLNEIKISARLDHPHILTLIDSGAADGFLYYVMPFVRGESLRDRLNREKQLGVDEALDISKQITSALDYAHRQGVVHRDIKPENILIHEGEAMLTDFGIAMAVKEAGGNRLTETGLSLGTPQYMSPEQATGDRALDSRSDVYSMGAVLYEMLAGEPPHSGATVQAVIAKLMTERPTRLRVMRDTVPEGIDTAVAKALAKIPADRYANAGDFARALATAAVPQSTSGRSRRWVPLAVGGGLAAIAAVAAALIVARKPAPRPQLDRQQVTLTGNAIAPSLSPDGARIAFAEKQCDAGGYCTYQLVIQDSDGSSRLVLARNIAGVWRTSWTSDGRFIAFNGSYGSARWGAFAVSTLGGEVRYFGCCGIDLITGDTAFVSPVPASGDSIAWVRRVTARDGQTLDSIPVRNPGADYDVTPLTYPDRLLVTVRQTFESPPELRLIDFRGDVIDRFTPTIGQLGRTTRFRWTSPTRQLLVASQRAIAGTEFDVLSMDVTPTGIERAADTVFSGIQMGDGTFEVSPDAERLVYSAGPVESSLWTIDLGRRSSRRFAASQVLSSTTLLRGRISPSGDRVFVVRDIPRGDRRASQFSIIPRNGGTEMPVGTAVEDLLDYEWSPDGARILYLHGTGAKQVRLMETDTTGRKTREIARFDRATAIAFQPLSDGAIALVPAERKAISITRRPGKPDVTWRAPEWISIITSVTESPDANFLAVEAWDRLSDSVVVATVSMETGAYTKLAILGGEGLGRVTWLDDGTIVFTFRETQGAYALFQIAPGKPPQRLGALPHTRATFSISADGKHMAAFSQSDKDDVYVIRNFGKMLQP